MLMVALSAVMWAMCDISCSPAPAPALATNPAANAAPGSGPDNLSTQYSFQQKMAAREAIFIPAWRALSVLTQNIFGGTNTQDRSLKALRVRKNLQRSMQGNGFPCNTSDLDVPPRSLKPPQSVHQLRPGDIDIVGALGDSLTAANGATALSIFHVASENRGLSWTGGGQGTWDKFLTIPNILKVFNPNLFGFSPYDAKSFQKASQFNVAEFNAMSQDLPWQASLLVKRMRSDPRVDIQRHWKLVTLMMGSNDFCSDLCYRKDPEGLIDQHRRDLTEAFRILKANLPRTFINLVIQPNLELLTVQKGLSGFCETLRLIACSCLHGERFKANRTRLFDIMHRYQLVEWEIGENPEFQTDDFTVVVQPFTYKLKWPVLPSGIVDTSWMAPDCFHFSQGGQARATNALWNNMLEPLGSKYADWRDPFDVFHCPSKQHPYLYTYKNTNFVNSNRIR